MGKKTTLQTKDEIAYYKGISSLVHYCVKYLKPIVLWFDVIVFAIAFSLICGILVLITSAGDEKYLLSEYNNGIKSFSTDFLNETSIETTINNETLYLSPFHPPQAHVLDNTGVSSYATFQFLYNDSNVFPILYSPFVQSPTFDIEIVAFYKNSTFNLKTNTFPLWYKNSSRLSLSRAAVNEKDCASMGGYITSDYTCETMYKVQQVCIQIEFDSDKQVWKNSENSGCNYPFTYPVEYALWNASSSEISFDDVNIVVVSADDPYVLLQELTMGSNSFKEVADSDKIRGNGLILSTTLGFVIVVITSIALFVTHRYWQKTKGGPLEDSVPIGANFDNKRTIFGWLSVGLVLLIIALSAGLPLLRFKSYTVTGYVGVFLFLICFPASFVCFSIFWKSIMKTQIISDFKKILVFVISCICCIVLIVYGFSVLVNPKEGPLVMFFGGLILIAYIPMTCLHILQIKGLAVRSNRGKHEKKPGMKKIGGEQTPLLEPRMYTFSINEGYLKDHFEAKKSKLIPYFLVFVVIFPFLFILTLFLPPLWNISLEYYAPFMSTYSLIDAEVDTGSLPWKLKMYFDVVAYYLFIYSLVFFSFLIKIAPSKIKKGIFSRRKFFGWNTCLGEILCISYVLSFFIFWMWYWGFHYSRIADSKLISRIPRTLGHATNFWLCFLLYPVSRNSIWSNVFGVPFERAIKYHRWSGFLFFVFNTLHFYFWMFHWYWENTLFSHMWSLTIDTTNFTVVTMTILYIPTNFMVVSAYEWVRRNYFEVFYYLHHFFIFLFIASLLHSWSLWYYISGPMILWAFDRTMRYYRGMESMRLVSLKYDNDTIILTIEKSNKQRFHFEAGQYCFLNIPSISLLQWHPFTISSAPGPNNLTFHIKQMSRNSWTYQLGVLARSGTLTRQVVNVDGPYGQTLDELKSSDVLILLAGGIGATPLHAIFKQFYYNAIARDPAHKMPKKIYFIWVSRNPEIFSLFAETLVKAAHYPEVFRVELFASQMVHPTVGGFEEAPGLSLKGGRPNLEKIFSEVVAEANALGRSVSTFVCGTKTLEREASDLCLKYDVEFYTESFVL